MLLLLLRRSIVPVLTGSQHTHMGSLYSSGEVCFPTKDSHDTFKAGKGLVNRWLRVTSRRRPVLLYSKTFDIEIYKNIWMRMGLAVFVQCDFFLVPVHVRLPLSARMAHTQGNGSSPLEFCGETRRDYETGVAVGQGLYRQGWDGPRFSK